MVGPKIAQLLVIALPSLVLAFAVFMGGYAVSATAGDKKKNIASTTVDGV